MTDDAIAEMFYEFGTTDFLLDNGRTKACTLSQCRRCGALVPSFGAKSGHWAFHQNIEMLLMRAPS